MQLSINTRLDAINYIIGCIGLAPVEAEDEYNLDVAQAAQALDNVSRTLQSNKGNGWWFNREENWMLSPDPMTFQVLVPNNTLSVYYVNNFNQQVRMTTRGRALYDVKKYRFDMRPFADSNGQLNLTIITQQEFDDLPFTCKDFIAKEAGVRFASSNEMDINRIKVLQEKATQAYFDVEAEQTAQQKNNAFKDNMAMASFSAIGGGPNNWS